MKKTLGLLLSATLSIFILALTGCETESVSESSISISPNSVQLEKDQSATFTASGGYEYTWSLSDDSLGTLSTKSGSTTTYTSHYDPGTNGTSVIQVLTVSSTISGQSSSQALASAEAYIEHVGTEVEQPVSDLSISTSDTFPISQWDSVSFTASGGNGSYSWSLMDSSWGRLSTTVGSSVTYTCVYADSDTNTSTTALQILYVADSDGRVASYSITETH